MNKVRGEQTLTIGAVEYRLTPTHAALAAVEGRLAAGLFELFRRFRTGNPRHTDAAVILEECSRAGGKVLPYAQAWDYCLAQHAEAFPTAVQLLSARFGPPPEGDSGKAAATEN